MRKLGEETLSLAISIFWVLIALVEMLVAYLIIEKRGINSFFVIESVVVILVAFACIIYVIIRTKFTKKLLLLNLLLLMVGMIVLFAQFLAPSLSSTMPYRYLTVNSVYGIVYRVDLLQGEAIPNAVLNIKSSSYIVNLNIILSIAMLVVNIIKHSKRRKYYNKINYN